MNILIHAIHYPVCSARYLVDAYRRGGHDVYHIGQETGRSIWGVEVPAEYMWSQETPPDGWEPDVAILMDTAYQWCHPTAPTIIHTVDNHVRNVRQGGIEHYFLAHKSVTLTDWGEDCTWLPCGYDRHWFTPSPIAWSDREFDVCMIGVMYPKRWELVNAMRAAGLKVMAGSGLVFDAYRDAHHNSRVALVSSFNGDLPIRLFEGAGMGCAVMSDRIEDLAHLDIGHPISIYSGVEGAVQLARALQTHPENGEMCAEWAKPHTWDARAQVIIDWMEARNDR